jgi:hypothetical protein
MLERNITLADSAYGSAEMLGWSVNERAIEPHIPVFDKSARDVDVLARRLRLQSGSRYLRLSSQPAPRQAQAERPVRCSRRVPPRCHSPEPPKDVKADPAARPMPA